MRTNFKLVTSLGVSLLAMAAPAMAQDAAAENADEQIIVTGTLVRGIAPAGTNVVGVTAADIKASSATTVTELLTDVPQFGAFNDLQTISGGGNFVTTNRPNLRSLPGFTTTGTSATLLLIDGHRVVGMGIASTTPDADFAPPGIIERVDIMPDGGSALYGSDAVAGVVNFITIKRFNGVKADARYGFGKEYHTFDANVTVGKEWDRGSLWASYNYTENSQIFGRDRAYNFSAPSLVAGTQVLSLECPKANVNVGGIAVPGNPFGPAPANALYASPVSTTNRGTSNLCDLTDEAGMYPEQKRHSIYAGFNQQLSDSIELDIRAFYYRKESEFSLGQYSSSINVVSPTALAAFGLAQFGFTSSPFRVSPTGYFAETQAVNFALGPNNLSIQNVALDAWGITPTITADLGGGWRLKTLIGYSESDSLQTTSRLVPVGTIAPLVASGEFNPYDSSTLTAATLAKLTNWQTYGRAKQSQFNARAIVDGDIFELPGGAAKLAFGAEYIREGYDSRKGDRAPADVGLIPEFKQSRNVTSVFGEIVAPLIGGDGPSLTVSAAGRYDHYSGFGDTFNPKIGVTFKPIESVSIRGAWGKSFVAPSLADSAIADPTGLNWIDGATLNFIAPPAVLAANGFPAVGSTQKIMFLLGSTPGLKPQKAKTWSVGIDIQPSGVPGLKLSGTYYNITYTDIIQLVPFINQNQFFSVFAPVAFTRNPTQAQIDAITSTAGSTVGAPCAPQPSCVYGIQDVRKRNLGGFKQDGIDFNLDYRTTTGFGGVDFGFGGTHVLNQKNAPSTGAAYIAENTISKWKIRTALGADIGNFRAQAIWNYRSGWDLQVPVGLNNQTKVGGYSTFDLFLKYDFAGEGALADLSLTLNVNNVFDKYPPLYFGGDIVRNQSGFRNGNTVGRLVQVGLSKKF